MSNLNLTAFFSVTDIYEIWKNKISLDTLMKTALHNKNKKKLTIDNWLKTSLSRQFQQTQITQWPNQSFQQKHAAGD